MKILILLLTAMTTLTSSPNPDTIHRFTVKDIRGRDVNLGDFKGKVVLVVNTASKCGFTPQYKDLQALHDRYKDRGLVVVGFPANEFGGQEPGTDDDIAEFCEVNYGVNFPLMSKVVVKGDGIHPLFQMLTNQVNPDFNGAINWNFEKFLIKPDGTLARRFRSRTAPSDRELISAVEALLPK